MAAHVLDRASRSARAPSRREDSLFSRVRQVDLILIAAALLVSVIGLVAVYAATRTVYTYEPSYYLKRQIVFSIVGLGVMAAVAYFDYHRLEQWAYLLYGAIVFCLLAVFGFHNAQVSGGTGGTSSGTVDRWIPLGPFQFQPSEFAILTIIAVLALYLTRHSEELDLRHVVPALALAVVPFLIIVKQDDLGTSIVMLVVTLALLLVGGVKLRHILAFLVLGALGFFVAIKIGLIHAYQIQRLTDFLHPNTGSLGANYQVDRAKLAIGAGGFSGTGFFHGVFTNGEYVPEQSTDFIFATVGEQLGFLGSAVIIALYAVMALRMWRAAQSARDGLGRLVCVGVLTFVAFSVFQNIGMNVGLMPVTGIPLPLISYGGSAIIVFYAAVGLVLNVEMRRGRVR